MNGAFSISVGWLRIEPRGWTILSVAFVCLRARRVGRPRNVPRKPDIRQATPNAIGVTALSE